MAFEIENRNPPTAAKPIGYSHSTLVTGAGKVLLLGGVTGMDADGKIAAPGDLVAQMDKALANIVEVLRYSGATPENIARIRIYTPVTEIYRAKAMELGQVWKKHFSHHYPAMALLGVAKLYDPKSLVEIECEAYLP